MFSKYSKKAIKKLFRVKNAEEDSYFLNRIKIFTHKLFNKSTKVEIERRRELSIFDYKALAKTLSYYPFFSIHENNFYGTAYTLSKHHHISRVTRIEHGLAIGTYVASSYLSKTTKKIYTLSDYRKKFIEKKTNKKIICVGPYIQYASYILSEEELHRLKNKLGRILLVFPSHSIDAAHAKYDPEDFINLIESKKTNFDTIMVCMFWKDIELKSDRYYSKQGYRIVTAGHLYDYYFLDRLKTIIALADMTVSNNVGTHIGYCIAMNKPHFVYDSSVIYLPGLDKKQAEIELNLRKGEDLASYQRDKSDIINHFSHYEEKISVAQRNCIDYYWGVAK